MLRNRFPLLSLLLVVAAVSTSLAESLASGASQRREAVARLGVLGSVLMIAAHPDDEQTATLAWCARGRGLRTAYLSLTRGEGGQNLIGSEQSELLGVIRTQELLAARGIDGAEQFFTRAIDFGFSKSVDETLDKWGREAVLGDVVWVIRNFRPDVIVVNFSGTPRDGHGHHQASGILGREAFSAAADPHRFPDQLKHVRPWQARRLIWNAWGGAPQVDYRIDAGQWDAVLGYTYGELAGMSRSLHRSQGMGTSPRRGPQQLTFSHVAGERGSNLLDGVDTTWSRVAGGAEVGSLVAEALAELDPEHPERAVPVLLAARARAASLDDPLASYKLREMDEAVALCSGLWLDASANASEFVPGGRAQVTATAWKRAPVDVVLTGAVLDWSGAVQKNDDAAPLGLGIPLTRTFNYELPANAPLSDPYWLARPPQGELYTVADPRLIGAAEGPPVASVRFRLRFGKDEVELNRPVVHRYVDRSRGELVRPVAVVPAVAVHWTEPVLVFPDAKPKPVRLAVTAHVADAAGSLRIQAPPGWKIEPAAAPFRIAQPGQQSAVAFQVTPPASAARSSLQAVATVGGAEISSGLVVIDYPHFPPQTVFPRAEADAVRADVRVLAKRIGYVMGSGDDVPQALAQLGCEVRLLSNGELSTADLSGYDAIVTGVRAYNVRPDLRANQRRLLEYVERGGTLVVQYNVNDPRTDAASLANLGPYPFRLGRERVAVEEAPVTLPDPNSPLLREPNRILPADFEGWVQERGLYFASEWDPRYRTLFVSADPGEPPRAGGTLYTKYGRGAYVFTAYSWFRQLPAGVPGAYRIFANLLSAGKTLP